MPLIFLLLLALSVDQTPARRHSRWPGVIGGLITLAILGALGYFIVRCIR